MEQFFRHFTMNKSKSFVDQREVYSTIIKHTPETER